MQTAICVASVWCRGRKSWQRKEKKLPLISVCLFYIVFSKSFVKPNFQFYNIPRNESASLLWFQQSSHTHFDHCSDCCFMCSLTAFIFTCLGHLLTTTRHCRHSLDIFTLSKMRTFHTVDTRNTPVTWHWRALNPAENVANSRLWLRKSIYLWCVTVRQCSQHSR